MTTTTSPRNSPVLIAASLVFGATLIAASWILASHLREIGNARQSIVVKGLAEKDIQADYAEMKLGLRVVAPKFDEALASLRKLKPELDQFITSREFPASALQDGRESVDANYIQEELENGRTRQVQRGYSASQQVVIKTKDLNKIAALAKAALEKEASGFPITYSQPNYLVSDLEKVKMSLIGAATQNAKARADEFARVGQVKVGVMRSASQGAFYILPQGEVVDSQEYGGSYDKSTVNKTARVVVTIEYGIN